MGKREKARNQIEATLKALFSFPAIEQRIASMIHKVGVFAYREKDKDLFVELPKKVKRSGDAFLGMFRSQKSRPLASPMSYGFSFLAVPYPERYKW